jgi:hypothetical protein
MVYEVNCVKNQPPMNQQKRWWQSQNEEQSKTTDRLVAHRYSYKVREDRSDHTQKKKGKKTKQNNLEPYNAI